METFDGNIQVNRYDAEGLRHEMEENGSLVKFIFNPDREAVVEESSFGLTRYIRSSELIARNTDAARTYYHYVSDEMGSTTHIVDEDGIVLNHYDYDAWGNLTAQEEAVPNRFKFTGQQLDPVTQQYYLRARFYNPVIARFTQEDTYRGDGLNLYAYCQNNPVYYIDPTGHQPNCVKDAATRYMAEGMAKEDAYRRAYQELEVSRIAQNYSVLKEKQLNGSITVDEYRQLSHYERLCAGTTGTSNSKLNIDNISAAGNALNHAHEVQQSLGNRNLREQKTVASDGEINTISGYGDLPSYAQPLFNRSVSINDIIHESEKIGHNLSLGRDNGIRYSYFATHAEKQLSVLSDKPFGITNPMCPDCQNYFTQRANNYGIDIYAADAEAVRIFRADGSVLTSFYS